MCGISGYIGTYSDTEVALGARSISHRGPDAFGIFAEEDVVLAHHRLSILDLSDSANQPFHFEDLVLVFNGELYNFKDVRKELLELGYTFNTNSDTEVLIKAFHQWREKAVSKFIGMFAFAVYNKNDNSIFLFRDRMGVKPLFYTLEGGLAFGSELRAIIPVLKSKETDTDSIYEYFRLGYISGEKTIFKHVKKILPGHYLQYKNGVATIRSYWKATDALKASIPELDAAGWENKLHELLKDAFSKRMIADVPVGVFLSGGIDSSLVTSILQSEHGNIHTFTIGFDDERYNEAHIAKQVAQHLGTKHTEFTLEVADAADMLHHFYDIYDEPFADSSGIPTAIVSRLAANAGIKVVLSGEGGDELFCGYDRYHSSVGLYNKINKVPNALRGAVAGSAGAMYKSGLLSGMYRGNAEHKAAAASELLATKDLGNFYNSYIANQTHSELSAMLKQVPPAGYGSELFSEDTEGIMLYDLDTYLPDDLLVKMDRATMYSSIEGREPLLDHRVVELALQMPLQYKYRDGQTKWMLRQILGKYIPSELFNRPKKGFSIPIFKWFSQHMDSMFEHFLNKERLDKTGVFNSAEVLHEYRKYKWNKAHSKEHNIEKMWRILSFMMWWDKWNEKL